MIPRDERGRPVPAPPAPQQRTGGESTKRRPHCRFHCRECERHFSSLDAFEAHRTGSHAAPRLSLDGRRCVGPEHDPRQCFELALGVCKIGGGERQATIWRLSGDARKVRTRFGQVEDEPAVEEEPALAA